MGELIEFPDRTGRAAKDNAPLGHDLDATVVAYLAEGPETLRRRALGEGLSAVSDLQRVEAFFYSHLISRFRRVSEAFLSYLYVSRLATRDDLAPGYVSDLMAQEAPAVRIGDFCFALAAFYPEWVERRRSAMRVEDYVQIGAGAYASAAHRASPPRDRVFRAIAERFADYAAAMYEALRTLRG